MLIFKYNKFAFQSKADARQQDMYRHALCSCDLDLDRWPWYTKLIWRFWSEPAHQKWTL